METVPDTRPLDLDAIVIGAGYSGLRMLVELRRLDMTARIFEKGGDVGGTWYWNRYPGARTDSEAWTYCYDFDDELLAEWDWAERFPTQAQSLAYLRHVADRFDLRRDIALDTAVIGAQWSAVDNAWHVQTSDGNTTTARILVSAMGQQAAIVEPPFPGVDSFAGESYTSSKWPHTEVDLTGKRVAVVGAGATAVQIVPVVADQADELTVFQRTPNYILPARNYVATDEKRNAIKRRYKEVWEYTYDHPFGMYFPRANRLSTDVPDPDKRQQIFEYGWEQGGFRFLFETFDDLITNQDCNDEASEFVRNKIRSIVKDPDVAERLCPKGYPLGGKRPPAGHFYYEAYNRPNVHLVALPETPIAEIEPTGIRMVDGTLYEVDVIIWALGFDAVTGALSRLGIVGRDGRTIGEEWDLKSPAQHFGLCAPGFPNLFTLAGPQGAFGNFQSFMTKQVEWIGNLLRYAKLERRESCEVTQEMAESWRQECEEAIDATVLMQGVSANSWFLGANVADKKTRVMFYFGGVNAYNAALARSANEEFPGYVFRKPGTTPASEPSPARVSAEAVG